MLYNLNHNKSHFGYKLGKEWPLSRQDGAASGMTGTRRGRRLHSKRNNILIIHVYTVHFLYWHDKKRDFFYNQLDNNKFL